jgi:hypothetical protein
VSLPPYFYHYHHHFLTLLRPYLRCHHPSSPLSATETGDVSYLDQLSSLYLRGLGSLHNSTEYVFYYWPGDTYRSNHTLDAPARMWKDTAGEEVPLESSQFLYGVATLLRGVLEVPAASRTVAMQDVIRLYPSVLVNDHYRRWAFGRPGIFQMAGWGCAAAGMMTHSELVTARLVTGLCADDPNQYSYLNAITDTDTWIIAGVSEVLSAAQDYPADIALDPTLAAELAAYAASGGELVRRRCVPTTVTNWNGDHVDAIVFDPGAWVDHPSHWFSSYEGATVPTQLDTHQPTPDGSWDVSHARRFVQVFETFRQRHAFVGGRWANESLLSGLTAQLVYGAFNSNLTHPLISNFMDGSNGWFRVDFATQAGYPPYGLTRTLFDGGYGVWAEFNPDVATVMSALVALARKLWIVDDSGHGLDAVPAGAGAANASLFRFVEGSPGPSFGLALETLAADAYVDLGADASYATATGSIEMWFTYTLSGEAEDDLLNIFENGYYDFLLVRRAVNGAVFVYIEDNDIEVLFASTAANVVSPDTWHHLVVTQGGSGVAIYIDGVETTLASSPAQNSASWTAHLDVTGAWLGKGHWNGHIGKLDEVAIYDRALTATEVSQRHAGEERTSAITASVVARWSFDTPVDADSTSFAAQHYDGCFHRNSLCWLQFLPTYIPFL